MMKNLFPYATMVAFSCLFFLTADIEAQQILCVKKKLKASSTVRLTKGLRIATGTCPKGFSQLLSTDSFKGDTGEQGPIGPQGVAGSDANLENLVYGDGSAGALVVDDASGDVSLINQNLNFTNITISAGRQLTISRGLTVRCTGTFTNEGTVDSLYSSQNSTFHAADTNTVDAFSAAWASNFWNSISKTGELALDGSIAAYGEGGYGMTQAAAATWINPPKKACGEGAPGSGQTGFCGQTIKVFCKGQIVNNGTIDASAPNGGSGAGGGSGGFVVLASQTGITNNGMISANGGNGGNSSTSSGPGGGGGGGVIHLLAPTIDGTGSTLVLGGSPGADSGDTSVNPRRGGGGGGGLGGSGGHGGTVNADNSVGTATSGSAGHSLTTAGDPTALILQQLGQ